MLNPWELLRPRRRIVGMSAILLPFTESGAVDWAGFERLLTETLSAGLIPAVNMDTGFAALINPGAKLQVLNISRQAANGKPFLAGALVLDQPGDAFSVDSHRRAIDVIQQNSGTPIVFPSFGMQAVPEHRISQTFEQIARFCPRFYAFELGEVFIPFGRIFSLDTFERLLSIPQCIGAKHSSLEREPEWCRLDSIRRLRPDFQLLTGNDLAIDMVMFGSDYLLGLSAFAPDAFAMRDRHWEAGDPRFFEMNDALQFLGAFAFRPPTPAYRHNAAQFLRLRGRIACSRTHPQSIARLDSDEEVLASALARIERFLG